MSLDHLPQPERPRVTDDELIDRELDQAEALEEHINDATARVIASQIQGGQASDMYSFVSTGFIRDTIMREINRDYEQFDDDPAMQRRISFLSMYLMNRMSQPDGTKAIEGWSKLWLRESAEDDCPCCAEHISRNHRVGCPLGVDDEPQLDKVLQLKDGHGFAILHWLNYAGFRNMEELEDRARQFPDYFLGFFPSVEVFRQNYEVSPDAYLAQQYEIVEGDGGVYVFDR